MYKYALKDLEYLPVYGLKCVKLLPGNMKIEYPAAFNFIFQDDLFLLDADKAFFASALPQNY